MAHIRLLSKNEARIPKYKQREMEIDAFFADLGIPLSKWAKGAEAALKKFHPKDGDCFVVDEPFYDPKLPYEGGEWWYEIPKGADYAKGTVNGDFMVEVDFDNHVIKLEGVIFENRYATQKTLWRKKYPDVPITADPKADIAAVLSYAPDFSDEYHKFMASQK